MEKVKVRFAPSPTGILHVGGIRTALFDYFFAKSQSGSFILRNEDTDQARKVEGSFETTKESLQWLGVLWDEEVTQSDRLLEYQKFAEELIFAKKAVKEDGAIRFITPKTGATSWMDLIGKKEILFQNSDVEDFIILKKDGFPTYHLANVVDDHLMGITHVIRGEDWIPSTPKHILLYNALGWDAPYFAHVPNVLGTDGKKLSKRRGARSVLDFKKEGYLADALLNYLMLLGFSPKDNREILTKDEIIKEFSLDKVNSAPSVFDEKKLLWMNGEYIRKSQNSKLKTQILEFDKSLEEFDQTLLEQLIEPAKSRMRTLVDFKTLADPFITDFKTEPSEIKERFKDLLEGVSEWNKENLILEIKKMNKDYGYSFPEIYETLIGSKSGLPLADVFEILGREKTLKFLG